MPRGKTRRLMCSNTSRPITTDNAGIRRLTICHLVTLKLEWPVNEGRCPSKGCKIIQTQYFVPMERTAQIFGDLPNHRIAEGTLIKSRTRISDVD